MQQVDAWLKTADPDLKAIARELLEAANSPIPTPAEEEAREIGDMIEPAFSWRNRHPVVKEPPGLWISPGTGGTIPPAAADPSWRQACPMDESSPPTQLNNYSTITCIICNLL